eukprot:1195445-Prorocentrum_minimum.AAC.2
MTGEWGVPGDNATPDINLHHGSLHDPEATQRAAGGVCAVSHNLLPVVVSAQGTDGQDDDTELTPLSPLFSDANFGHVGEDCLMVEVASPSDHGQSEHLGGVDNL